MTKSQGLAELPLHVAAPDPSIYRRNDYVILDFETTTLSKGSPLNPDNRLVLACWRTVRARGDSSEPRQVGDKVCWGNEFAMEELVADVRRAGFLVAHNAKFELGWLRRCGLDLRDIIVFDTMIGEYVMGGNLFSLQHLSLAKCLERHELQGKDDTIGQMFKAGIDTLDMPESWLLKYCERDVASCEELFLKQRELLYTRGLEPIMYQRNLVTPCLTDIEFNGMQLDGEVVTNYERKQEDAYVIATTKLQEFCNGALPSSTKQMREFIFSDLSFGVPKDFRGNPFLTPSGEPSVAAPVMEKLVAKTKPQREFLALRTEWARLHSDVTKYLRKFGECVREDDGRLHGSFNQTTTKTHRLSSSGTKYRVQFQNFNRNFKPFFRARNKGWLVGEADGAQLEFRVAAHLGRDRVALKDIVEGNDIHKYTASVLNSVPEADVTKRQRTLAKADTFKPLYGGGSGTPAQRSYYEAFKAKYHGVADTQQGWTQCVLRDKHLTTEWGMRYYWPDTRLCQSGYITNTTAIYNYPVQAFATAEIIPAALVAAWHRMASLKSFLVNTVHDSLIAEVHPDEVECWHDIAKQCLIVDAYKMIKDLYNIDITVPLGAGVMVGTHWSSPEAQDNEVVYEAPDNLWRPAAEKEKMI